MVLFGEFVAMCKSIRLMAAADEASFRRTSFFSLTLPRLHLLDDARG